MARTTTVQCALLLPLVAAACFPREASAAYPVFLKDDRGRTVRVDSRPRRIVVAGSALNTEILVDLGARDRILGVTQSSENPEEVRQISSVGLPLAPNVEAILKLQPDVVIGAVGPTRAALESGPMNIVVYTGGR